MIFKRCEQSVAVGKVLASLFLVGALWACSEEMVTVADKSGAGSVKSTAEIPNPDLTLAESQVREAIETARQKVLEAPDRASAWGELAMNFDAHDLLPEAVVCYQQASQLAPEDYRWSYLSALVLRQEDLEAALEQFQTAAQVRPRNPAVYIHYGDALLDAGRPVEARLQYERAQQLDRGSAWALLGLGRAALADNSVQEARDFLAAAVREKKGFREAETLLAQVAQRLGDEEAAQLHMWVAGNYPESSAPQDDAYAAVVQRGVSSFWRSRKGLAHANSGRFAEAEKEYRAVLEAVPGSAVDFANLGGALVGQGRVEEGIEVLRQALERDPQEILALNNISRAWIQQGDLQKAARYLEESLAVDRLNLEARLNLGLVRAKEGDYAVAVEHFGEALKINPGDLRALEPLGQAFVAMGEPEKAIEPWRRVLTIDPQKFETLYGLAQLLATQGQHGEAIHWLKKGMESAPNSSRLAMFLAWELAVAPHAELREPDRAVALAQRVRGGYPKMAQAADVLAAAWAAQGNFANAARDAEEAVRLAQAQGRAKEATQYKQRLELYRAQRPFHL